MIEYIWTINEFSQWNLSIEWWSEDLMKESEGIKMQIAAQTLGWA